MKKRINLFCLLISLIINLIFSVLSFSQIDTATMGMHIANLAKCSIPLSECSDYVYLKQGLTGENKDFFISQIKETLIQNSDSMINVAIVNLIADSLSKEEAVILLSEVINNIKHNEGKINSFFIISLIILCGIGSYLIYLGIKIKRLRNKIN